MAERASSQLPIPRLKRNSPQAASSLDVHVTADVDVPALAYLRLRPFVLRSWVQLPTLFDMHGSPVIPSCGSSTPVWRRLPVLILDTDALTLQGFTTLTM
jgi:hypothetical protein